MVSSLQGHKSLQLPDPQALYQKLVEQTAKVSSLEGSAKVRLQTEDRRLRLEALIACERATRLRMEVTDFLNHVVFLLILREGRLAAFSLKEGLVVEDTSDSDAAARVGMAIIESLSKRDG